MSTPKAFEELDATSTNAAYTARAKPQRKQRACAVGLAVHLYLCGGACSLHRPRRIQCVPAKPHEDFYGVHCACRGGLPKRHGLKTPMESIRLLVGFFPWKTLYFSRTPHLSFHPRTTHGTHCASMGFRMRSHLGNGKSHGKVPGMHCVSHETCRGYTFYLAEAIRGTCRGGSIGSHGLFHGTSDGKSHETSLGIPWDFPWDFAYGRRMLR